MLKILITLLFAFSLASCGLFHAYHMDIQQGRDLYSEDIDKVKIGMSKAQVKKILGEPLLTNAFDTNQYDYIYTMQKAAGTIKEHQLLIYFTNDKVSNIVKKVYPEQTTVTQ